MWAGEIFKESRNQFIWKTTSHESIFQSSPPKSFAEEVANELSNRARSLGSSHPSVVTGKQKRLMDGLMNVAEAIRKDFPQTSNDLAISTLLKSNFSPTDTAETRDSKINETGKALDDADVKSHSLEKEPPNALSFQTELFKDLKNDIENKQNQLNLEISETSASGDNQSEAPSIHLRLAIDHSGYNGLPWIRSNMNFSDDETLSSTPQRHWKPPKPKRYLKAKKNASLIHFFQSRFKKKTKSEKKLKFRDRVLAILNNNTFRNFRKSFREAWSTKKSGESKFPDFKRRIFKSFNT